VAKFVCAGCGKTANVGDNCCGKPMVAGNFQCKSCGKVANTCDNCCGKAMNKI
jgi:hypothetical protein